MRTEFTKFKALKTLKLATNKLCFGPPSELMLANKLKEVLMNLNFLEELDLSENSMNDLKSTLSWTKHQIVEQFLYLIPDFYYKDTGKYLDGKM